MFPSPSACVLCAGLCAATALLLRCLNALETSSSAYVSAQNRRYGSRHIQTRSGATPVTNTQTRTSNFLPKINKGRSMYFCATHALRLCSNGPRDPARTCLLACSSEVTHPIPRPRLFPAGFRIHTPQSPSMNACGLARSNASSAATHAARSSGLSGDATRAALFSDCFSFLRQSRNSARSASSRGVRAGQSSHEVSFARTRLPSH